MTTQHTPGPWSSSGTAGHETHGQSVVYSESSGTDIAIIYDGKSNAHLIAAAPDLLAALDDITDLPANDNGSRIIPAGYLDAARAAIAKARPL